MSWQNRIIGNDVVNPKSLDLNEKNWRKHPLFQEEALEGIMETIGWIQDVIVNKSTNKVVDGHLRIKLAIKHKQKLIPIKYVDLTQEEENIALATFDPIGAMAQAEQTLLKGLLEDVQSDNDKINALFEQVSQGYGALDSADISSVQPKDEEARKSGMTVGISDPVWKQLGDTGCCCGILPDDPVFGNWQRESATNQLLEAKNTGKKIHLGDITPKWAYHVLHNKMALYNPGPDALFYRRHAMWADHLRSIWNNVSRERSPTNYFQGALMPIGLDENKDVVYEYRGLTRQFKQAPFWKLDGFTRLGATGEE